MNGWLTVLVLGLAFVQGGFAVVILVGQRHLVRVADRMIDALLQHSAAERYRQGAVRPFLTDDERETLQRIRDRKEAP